MSKNNENTVSDIMPATEVRDNFRDVLEYIDFYNRPVTITRRGRGKVVMMSYDEFDSWRETLDIIANNPNIVADLKAADEEIKRGEYVTLDEIMAREGELSVAEKREVYRKKKGK